MDYNIDEIMRVITIKCTEEERPSIEKDVNLYAPDYELNFIIQKQTTDQ